VVLVLRLADVGFCSGLADAGCGRLCAGMPAARAASGCGAGALPVVAGSVPSLRSSSGLSRARRLAPTAFNRAGGKVRGPGRAAQGYGRGRCRRRVFGLALPACGGWPVYPVTGCFRGVRDGQAASGRPAGVKRPPEAATGSQLSAGAPRQLLLSAAEDRAPGKRSASLAVIPSGNPPSRQALRASCCYPRPNQRFGRALRVSCCYRDPRSGGAEWMGVWCCHCGTKRTSMPERE
jgi:hypothetical protein